MQEDIVRIIYFVSREDLVNLINDEQLKKDYRQVDPADAEIDFQRVGYENTYVARDSQ